MRIVVTGMASSQLRMGDMASEIDDSMVTADSSGPTTATFSSTLAATPGRVEFVDGVRALAALYVVAHHAYITVYPGFPINTGPSVFTPLIYGHFGVAIFMVVSGYSLALYWIFPLLLLLRAGVWD